MVQKVYIAHLKNIDIQFEKIPEGSMKNAMDEFREKLPELFELCKGDWFGIWVLQNRHRGRFQGSKKRNDLEGSSTLIIVSDEV